MRAKIADKILRDELLTQAEWNWLAKHSMYNAERWQYEEFTPEKREQGRETARRNYVERKRLEADAYRKAYSEILQRLLAKAGDLQEGALDKALAELQAEEPDVALIRLGVNVAKDVADRNMGKATQRIEGKIDHKHSALDQLYSSGALEIEAEVVEEINDDPPLELEAG